MPKARHLNLSRYVPGLLTFLSNKLATGASHCYRKHFGIGVVEWRVLSMLAVENHITANRICQVIGLDKSAVSRSLQSLEAAGYVSGQVDTVDARRYTVSLTDNGQALHDRVLKGFGTRAQVAQRLVTCGSGCAGESAWPPALERGLRQ